MIYGGTVAVVKYYQLFTAAVANYLSSKLHTCVRSTASNYTYVPILNFI